jgi:hypothetical protein
MSDIDVTALRDDPRSADILWRAFMRNLRRYDDAAGDLTSLAITYAETNANGREFIDATVQAISGVTMEALIESVQEELDDSVEDDEDLVLED